MIKNFSKFLGLLTLLTVSSIVFGSGKVHAATINVPAGNQTIAVNGICSLPEAIININDQANTKLDCGASGPAYGTHDTIQMGAGTFTLQEGINNFTEAITIEGSGIASTMVDLNGYNGFGFNNNNADFMATNFKIVNGLGQGLGVGGAYDVNISNLEIGNSERGLNVNTALHIDLDNVNIHDNTFGPGSTAGAYLAVDAKTNTDIPAIRVINSKITSNHSASNEAGLFLRILNATAASGSIIVQNSYISGNVAGKSAGVNIDSSNSAAIQVLVDAVTVSDNIAIPTVASSDPNPLSPSYISGFLMNIVNLADGHNIRNVTVANNSSINNVDYHLVVAGFLASLMTPGNTVNVINTSVVGNSMTQSESIPSPLGRSNSFMIANYGLGFQNLSSGGSAQNTLIANNTYNGLSASCRSDFDKTTFGGSGQLDLTPVNLGNNISDDQTCTGYTYAPSLYDTIEHNVADNGGPVPTIKLLPGSPAIASASKVNGITTDARGIARPTTPDVGAYQTVLGTSTTVPRTNFAGISVPNTGIARKSTFAQQSSVFENIAITIIPLMSSAIITAYKRKTNA